MDRTVKWDLAVAVGLIVVGVMARLAFRDWPNFAPVAGFALFSGYYFRSWHLAAAVPLAVMLISDQFLGGYDWRLQLVIYSLLAGPVFARGLVRQVWDGDPASRWTPWITWSAITGASLASSVLFFVGSNLAVWGLGNWYAHTWQGLTACLINALPFFQYTVAGDLVFSWGAFAGLAVVQSYSASRRWALR